MALGRPAIPKDIEREVLLEARHRCSVCCAPLPLQRAHICAWSTSHSHASENLIALCANCHSRADHENWGERALRRYKQSPCAIIAHAAKPASPEQQCIIDLILACDPEDMTAMQRRRLVSMVAAYAEVSIESVTITEVRPHNSSIASLIVPEHVANRLAAGWMRRDPLLIELLEDIPVIEIMPPRPAWGSAEYSGVSRRSPVVVVLPEMSMMQEEKHEEAINEIRSTIKSNANVLLVLDFSNVQHITSMGMGSLIKLQNELKARGGTIVLAGVPASIAEVFRITKVDRLFPMYTSVPSAIAGVTSGKRRPSPPRAL